MSATTTPKRAAMRELIAAVRALNLRWKHTPGNTIVCELGDCPLGALIRANPDAHKRLLDRLNIGLPDSPEFTSNTALMPIARDAAEILDLDLDVCTAIAGAADGADATVGGEHLLELRAELISALGSRLVH